MGQDLVRSHQSHHSCNVRIFFTRPEKTVLSSFENSHAVSAEIKVFKYRTFRGLCHKSSLFVAEIDRLKSPNIKCRFRFGAKAGLKAGIMEPII